MPDPNELAETLAEIERRTTRPESVPAAKATRVLNFLNRVGTARELYNAVELLGEEDYGLVLAERIIDERGRLGTYSELRQVASVEGLGPERFTELVFALGETITPIDPPVSSDEHPIASASETVLRFSYEVLLPGPFQGLKGEVLTLGHSPRYCTACEGSYSSFNEQLGVWEARVQITRLILEAEDDNFIFSITMDLRMRPYDWMHPLDKNAKKFQFPAKMQLNNSMIIKTRVKATGQMMTLVSRDVPCQVGRVMNWPPYGMTLYTEREIKYHDSNDPLGPAVLLIRGGTTYLFGKSDFLSTRIHIDSYNYVPADGERGLPAVELRWRTPPEKDSLTDHYHVYRTADPLWGEASWINVSGNVKETNWIDPNPPAGPLHYRVVPVMVTLFGEDYEGFPGQVLRVEPARSVFRV